MGHFEKHTQTPGQCGITWHIGISSSIYASSIGADILLLDIILDSHPALEVIFHVTYRFATSCDTGQLQRAMCTQRVSQIIQHLNLANTSKTWSIGDAS